MRPRQIALVALAAVAVAAPLYAGVHLTLVDSGPREGAALTDAPQEIWLKFNERLDVDRRAIAIRGPGGPVAVGPVRTLDSLSFAVDVTGEISAGSYTVSWLAGAPDHATIRGRYSFSVAGRD